MSQKIYTNLDIKGNATIGDISNATSDTDKFLVSDAGVVKYRTGSEMLSDLGVAPGVASNVQHQVKAGVAINKGQAVYVTSADGTNMIVGLASNASEATSSKTMGLLDNTVAINGFANVVTEGLLAGLNTIGANAGDPVWLGTGGNLIYGLANKPSAPAHLVFIGIVTRVNANNGEIFIKAQNGFELNEIHDVDLKTTSPSGNEILAFEGAPVNLWKNKTIPSVLGYTPVPTSRTITINGNTQDLSANLSFSIASGVTSFNTRTGAITLTSGDVTTALGYTPYNSSNPAGYISSYTETDPTVPSHVKAITTTNISNWNTAFGWGNHASAGYLTSVTNISGNAGTATTLQTARTINGTSFNGSSNIETSYWGTTRTLTIGNTGKTVNGSGNQSWSLAEIGAQPAGSYLTSETNTFLGDGGNADTHPGTDRIIFTGQLSTGAAILGMPATDNSNAILNINRHPGEYNSQLGFSSNGSMYYRSFSAAAINSTQTWRQVWDSGNFTNNSSNWNTAFGWGNHASAGYVPGARTITINGTSYDLSANRSWTVTASETDTLQTVTSRGNVTSTPIILRTSYPYLQFEDNVTGSVNFAWQQLGVTLGGSGTNGGGYFTTYSQSKPFGWTVGGNQGVMTIDTVGNVQALASSRAPIFYDSNDTSYYLDPNSTSRLLAVNAPSGFTSVGNPWGTANSAYFPNGITTAGSDNWIYGHTYVGNAPANGAGHEFWSTGKEYHRSSEATTSQGASGRWLSIQSANGNFIPYSFESEYGNHSWGTVARFRINQSGADRPSIQFSNASNDTRWNIGYCYADDNFRIVQNMGYRNDNSTSDGWGTQRLLLDTAGNFYSDGLYQSNASLRAPIFYDSNNTGYYVDPASTSVMNVVQPYYLRRNSHSTGHLEGSYNNIGGNSANSNPIYTIGSSYNPTDSSLSNMYGVGYAHPNFWGSGKTNSWGMYVAEGGTFVATIGVGIWTSGDVTAYSDIRVKDNIEVIENALDKIKAIRGVTFTRKDASEEDKDKRHAGVIAQEVMKVLPEVVTGTEESKYSVAYGNMAGLFIEAIKEQQKQIEELKELVNQLIKK